MENLKIGAKVIIIRNESAHGMPLGSIVTIRAIRKIEGQIHIEENDSYFYLEDIEQIIHEKKRGNFIITDPIEILSTKTHKELEKENIEEIEYPRKIKNTKIIIHKIEETPYGNGFCYYEKQTIVVKSKTLCIAEHENGWDDLESGATFETLQEAQDKFQIILNKF